MSPNRNLAGCPGLKLQGKSPRDTVVKPSCQCHMLQPHGCTMNQKCAGEAKMGEALSKGSWPLLEPQQRQGRLALLLGNGCTSPDLHNSGCCMQGKSNLLVAFCPPFLLLVVGRSLLQTSHTYQQQWAWAPQHLLALKQSIGCTCPCWHNCDCCMLGTTSPLVGFHPLWMALVVCPSIHPNPLVDNPKLQAVVGVVG
eukprot:GGOE01000685.1.p2 GENE.GGOE01000685.1~~GGOE01000685.1.p2  ORF type:complete len:197 (-),score=10.38 GGOE01000685.1:317-907(-)